MDESAIAQATPQQLAIAFGAITDKKMLYEGHPTEIISNEERRALDELVPELIAECHRRGIPVPEAPPQIEGEWREERSGREHEADHRG